MKTLLFLTVFISGLSFAQTSVISAKSHASSRVLDENDLDNFGGPEICLPIRLVQSVEYLKPDCIVEKCQLQNREDQFVYDTICQHPFLQSNSIDISRIKAMYPEGTKFKGFDKLEKGQNKLSKKLKNAQKQEEQNSVELILILICLSGFLAYLFIPNMNRSKTRSRT